jgi:hypothetical protein
MATVALPPWDGVDNQRDPMSYLLDGPRVANTSFHLLAHPMSTTAFPEVLY